MDDRSPIIVVGASVGGVDALCRLVAGLPADFGGTVFVVLHIGTHRSELPSLLRQAGHLPASHAIDGEPIRRGHIYVAPPDHHMVLEQGVIRLSRGPRENWARPAVDPLFRSAAIAFGARTVGVILTGGLNDGTAGLFEIKQQGGLTVVQDPDDATDPGMPRSALRHVAVDHCLFLDEIAPLLVRLAAATRPTATLGIGRGAVRAGSEEMIADYKLDEPVTVTCPDCGGALRRTELGTLTQFRCHIGHVYTAEVMVTAQFSQMQWSLAAAMRAMSERGELCRVMAEKSREAGDAALAGRWEAAMEQARDRAGEIGSLLERDWSHPDEPGSAPRLD